MRYLLKTKYAIYLLLIFLAASCVPQFNSIQFQRDLKIRLVDSLATRQTVSLFYNLKKISEVAVIFGHQHSTVYGVEWKSEYGRSDLKDVTGAFPGLYGWDFSDLKYLIKNQADELWYRRLILDAYRRGGVNTFSWHLFNPVTGNSFYDTTVAVKYILPGEKYHSDYVSALDTVAEFISKLIDKDDNPIPIIFRPFHEFDGSWFWWGKHFCSKEEFIALWRFTVEYLRDVKRLRNILYAFSPDRLFYSEAEYLERYPGDDYVDILGMDNYYDFTPEGDGIQWVTRKLQIVSRIAKQKNKIAAFTETGLESIPDSNWWTEKLLPILRADDVRIAYVMLWRNADRKHHYIPFKGDISERNFITFKHEPFILFGDELPELYSVSLP